MPKQKSKYWYAAEKAAAICRAKQFLITSFLSLKANALENDVHVVRTGCFGLCNLGPVVKVMPDNVIYTRVKPEDSKKLLKNI